MNLQGTPGRTKVIVIDPNNQRVDLDVQPNFSGGTFNQVTVDSSGRVVSGKMVVQPVQQSTTKIIPSPSGFQAQSADYGGGTPDWVPTIGNVGLAIDTGTTRIWWYYNSTWQ